MNSLLTIGHSNHDADVFMELLAAHEIEAVADVRSWPRSRFAPQYNEAALKKTLDQEEILYVHLGNALGGRPASDRLYHASGRADYGLMAQETQFRQGLSALLDLARLKRTAILCSERDPHLCHRALLVAQEIDPREMPVAHILPTRAEPWPHADFLEDLARRWKVQDTGEAVRLQASRSAYQR